MKRNRVAFLFSIFSACSATLLLADITPRAHYSLGEPAGHGANLLPQDASGNGLHFVNHVQGSLATLVGGGAHSGSTNHVQTPSNSGWWGANLSSIPADNFAFGVWARAVNNSAAQTGDVFTTGGGSSSNYLRLSLTSAGWQANSQGNAWSAVGAFTADQWVHLMMLRRNGVAQFFINGSSVGSSFSGPVENQGAHLGVNPNLIGGDFVGDIDDIRVVTFSPNDSNSAVHTFVAFGIPQPSAGMLLMGLLTAIVGFQRRRD